MPRCTTLGTMRGAAPGRKGVEHVSHEPPKTGDDQVPVVYSVLPVVAPSRPQTNCREPLLKTLAPDEAVYLMESASGGPA